MKKNNLFVFIYLNLFLSLTYAQRNSYPTKAQIVDFLVKECLVYDANPIHQNDTTEIYDRFKTIIEKKNDYSLQEMDILRIDAFKMLYDNAISTYEDSTDVLRLSTRRILCYMILAMLSPSENRFYQFLDCAKLNIKAVDFDVQFQCQKYVLIDLLKVLMLLEQPYIADAKIKMEFSYLDKYIIGNYKDFSEHFLRNLSELGFSNDTKRNF